MSEPKIRPLGRNNVTLDSGINTIKKRSYAGNAYVTIPIVNAESAKLLDAGLPLDKTQSDHIIAQMLNYVQWRGISDIVDILQNEINQCGWDATYAKSQFGPEDPKTKLIQAISTDWEGACDGLEKLSARGDTIPKLKEKMLALLEESAAAGDKLEPVADDADMTDPVVLAKLVKFGQTLNLMKKNKELVNAIKLQIIARQDKPKAPKEEGQEDNQEEVVNS